MFESDAQKGIEHSETIKQWIALAQRSYDKMKKTVGRGYPQLACDIEKSQNAATCMKDGRFCGKDNWLEIKYQECLVEEIRKGGYDTGVVKKKVTPPVPKRYKKTVLRR